MQVRNSTIGKLVISSERPINHLNLDEITYITTNHTTLKGGVGKKEIPEIVAEKKVIVSPPKIDFKVQTFPLKRMNKGLSGWDWETVVSDEEDLNDKALSCKPKHSTFSKLFPSRNFDLNSFTRRDLSVPEPISLSKEFNRKTDRLSNYREAMLKAQKLFKMQ